MYIYIYTRKALFVCGKYLKKKLYIGERDTYVTECTRDNPPRCTKDLEKLRLNKHRRHKRTFLPLAFPALPPPLSLIRLSLTAPLDETPSALHPFIYPSRDRFSTSKIKLFIFLFTLHFSFFLSFFSREKVLLLKREDIVKDTSKEYYEINCIVTKEDSPLHFYRFYRKRGTIENGGENGKTDENV